MVLYLRVCATPYEMKAYVSTFTQVLFGIISR